MRTPFAPGGRHRRQEQLLVECSRQLSAVAEELRRANLIQHHRLLVEQLDRAIDDPTLAAAMSTLRGLTEVKRRQMLFANREYGVLLLTYRVDGCTWDELLSRLRIMCHNDLFAEYWSATLEHRKTLPEESLEAKVGQAVDAILEDLRDDRDEWWVVGLESPPPPPQP
ncbi:DUF6082 family protein [Streptomyces sp. GXMU-J15]|uniref:DUF6082 family protein n=1 Tax=Streptomyces fuscus TaxID=3048495 RepID=A0ABT7J5A7_9ACTN|nr:MULTISPECIES: DUF6082 family protein [Streptomyces]MDL2080055.1 DUF6082 family protein [Streptomyces fuscus]